MDSRPFVALHMSTGTYTSVAGRIVAGRVNASDDVPLAIAPFKWTTPPMTLAAAADVPNGAFVQPFSSVTGLNEAAAG